MCLDFNTIFKRWLAFAALRIHQSFSVPVTVEFIPGFSELQILHLVFHHLMCQVDVTHQSVLHETTR